ncbi:hypothetical protein X798_07343 [Onchocerca flexuosa]|uniref:Uncharacterized protein n=1 Tax=Onchocerca flexuosa TaxID=387005 RepID=A0A238BKC6_9BILA|nr:hypothetical protein X798_07343 [Onchocerca flexuosa]
MEPHPSIPASTPFTTSTSLTVDICFDSTTTVYYTIAPISYAVDVSSSIPYRDVIASKNNVSSEEISPETCSKARNSSDNIEQLSDDNPSKKCNESAPFNIDSDSQVKDEIQQSPLSSNLETIVSVQRLPLSLRLKPNTTVQRLPLSSILEPNIMTQQLPLASNLKITAIQPLPLHSTKSLQVSDDFQQNLPTLRKIRLLNDKATHYARLAQDAWEEARTIAASLNMPPPTLPDAVDFMSHSYMMKRREWDLPKIADVQERIEPVLSQVVSQECIVSSSSSSFILQSIPERIKLSPKLILSTNSKSDSNLNQVSWMKKNTCRYNNGKVTKNTAAETINQQLITTSLQSNNHMKEAGLHQSQELLMPSELAKENVEKNMRSNVIHGDIPSEKNNRLEIEKRFPEK